MEDLGMFVHIRLSEMSVGTSDELMRLAASVTLNLIDGIRGVVAERTENYEAYLASALPILPYQHVKIVLRKHFSEPQGASRVQLQK